MAGEHHQYGGHFGDLEIVTPVAVDGSHPMFLVLDSPSDLCDEAGLIP
jgi:hypothetical protein